MLKYLLSNLTGRTFLDIASNHTSKLLSRKCLFKFQKIAKNFPFFQKIAKSCHFWKKNFFEKMTTFGNFVLKMADFTQFCFKNDRFQAFFDIQLKIFRRISQVALLTIIGRPPLQSESGVAVLNVFFSRVFCDDHLWHCPRHVQ